MQRESFSGQKNGENLDRFAKGDRTGAIDHFQKAVGTRAVWIYPWAWSQMFFSRLDKSPNWPPWISVKEDRPKPGIPRDR